jgi:SAM-dependent methyltransferase
MPVSKVVSHLIGYRRALEYTILRLFLPLRDPDLDGTQQQSTGSLGAGKLSRLLGAELLASVRDRVVIDFGCGEGHESIEMAKAHAKRVVGTDIREDMLELARLNAAKAGMDQICHFTTSPEERADLVISIDAFEHFGDPKAVLRAFDDLLVPGGTAVISFGPTWYHPMGGHLFSVFPWAHLVFTESALLRWRADYRSDGAHKFSEVAGGLNQMTIRRFEDLVHRSPFRFARFEVVPITRLRLVHNRITREFTTSIVRCELARK